MKKYKQVYLDYFDYNPNDFIPCELTGGVAVDIHHLKAKGVGGSKLKDYIENLMALTRKAHQEFGDIKELIEPLENMHKQFMITKIPIFNHYPSKEDILNWKPNKI